MRFLGSVFGELFGFGPQAVFCGRLVVWHLEVLYCEGFHPCRWGSAIFGAKSFSPVQFIICLEIAEFDIL